MTARFVKFEAFSWYGSAAGLQYFKLKKSGSCFVNERGYESYDQNKNKLPALLPFRNHNNTDNNSFSLE